MVGLSKQYFIANDIKKVLSEYLIENIAEKHFPPQINNGLLKNGVCRHYADYLQEFLPKIGIDAVRIGGTSILIVVGVVLETYKQLESSVASRSYNKR